MWLLQSHYSQPIDYSEEILEEKRRSYERLRNLYTQIGDSTSSSKLSDRLATELKERFHAAMRHDFDTPRALAAIFETAGRVGQDVSARPEAAKQFLSFKEALAEVLFTLGFTLPVWSQLTLRWNIQATVESEYKELPQQVQGKVVEREQARREKNWAVADRLRDELHAEGWAIEDTPEGPALSRR
jgi:cysteinyl-tRNA synthetase